MNGPGGSPPMESIKIVLVGDVDVGKTSLLQAYTSAPRPYASSVFDSCSVMAMVDGRMIPVHLTDTTGQEDYEHLRLLSYPGADVFLLCFSIISPASFASVRDKWWPELSRNRPDAKAVLVGTKVDMRYDPEVLVELQRRGQAPVNTVEGEALARQIGAVSYVESSDHAHTNLFKVFDDAIRAGLRDRQLRGIPLN